MCFMSSILMFHVMSLLHKHKNTKTMGLTTHHTEHIIYLFETLKKKKKKKMLISNNSKKEVEITSPSYHITVDFH